MRFATRYCWVIYISCDSSDYLSVSYARRPNGPEKAYSQGTDLSDSDKHTAIWLLAKLQQLSLNSITNTISLRRRNDGSIWMRLQLTVMCELRGWGSVSKKRFKQ
uniref:Uncharacterized protein n=1 Tax=Physcomitrium patens TaxID=3218 RepID=A0A2K1II85_PHYPA|nr:hypothetical protein PHYPA_027670 [Physcomitrium patens]